MFLKSDFVNNVRRKIKKRIIRLKYFILFLLKLRFDFADKRFYIDMHNLQFVIYKFNINRLFIVFYLLASRNIFQYSKILNEIIYEKIKFPLRIKQVYFLLGCLENKGQNFICASQKYLFTYNRRTNRIFVIYSNSNYFEYPEHLFISLPNKFKGKNIEEILNLADKIIIYNYKHFDSLISKNKKNNKNLKFEEVLLGVL